VTLARESVAMQARLASPGTSMTAAPAERGKHVASIAASKSTFMTIHLITLNIFDDSHSK